MLLAIYVSANNESALGRAQRTWWICVLKQRPGYAPGEGGQSSALDARAPLPSMWALNREGSALGHGYAVPTSSPCIELN